MRVARVYAAGVLLAMCAALLSACTSDDALEVNPSPTIEEHMPDAPEAVHTPDPLPTHTPESTPTEDEDAPDWQGVDDAGCILTPAQMEDVTGQRIDEAVPMKYGYADDRSCSYLWDGLQSVMLYTVLADSEFARVIRQGHEARYLDVQTIEVPGATEAIIFNAEYWVHMVVGDTYVMVEAYSDEHPTPVVLDVAAAVAQELTNSRS